MIVIYALADPVSGQVRYVGKTDGIPKRRLDHHVYNWKRSLRRHVDCWIKSLADLGQKPEMFVLDEVSLDDWEFWEQYWIEQFRAWGANLCNHAQGGKGTPGFKPRSETILLRNERNKTSVRILERNRRHSEIMKQKHAQGTHSFGYGHLSEDRRKHIGINHSEQLKQKHQQNPEWRKSLIKSRVIPVEQLNEEGQIIAHFDSASDAGRQLNIFCTHITRVCKGKAAKTHGMYFRYATT